MKLCGIVRVFSSGKFHWLNALELYHLCSSIIDFTIFHNYCKDVLRRETNNVNHDYKICLVGTILEPGIYNM